MATESSEGEEDAKLTGGNQLLVVNDDLREMGKKAAWSVSSCKAGNGVSSLRDDNLDTYWQSDGAQPHLVNVQFQRKVQLIMWFKFFLGMEMLYKTCGGTNVAGSGFDERRDTAFSDSLFRAVGLKLNGPDFVVRRILILSSGDDPFPSHSTEDLFISFLKIIIYIIPHLPTCWKSLT
ncbi:anaphase-promoting complex subunit 10 [Pyrus ussuriensis x Pyrus communis]|uniref:Anaphase-promoting complex subunit 10 n=1 Tax=Pyrus ussuriensis x Pyrus communis TaxID=2448454 RepID=A0A5N5HHQ0_9ROSA|nr:anaphase-promoting complex subunit 10 [Pyrus ussuriensis x Pyrus communis]